jgi:hypothetical protein
MAVNKNSLENLKKGKKFTADEQPANRGRKPSVLRFIKDNGVSITDIKLMLGSFIFDHTPEEIAKLLRDKKNPPPIGISIILAALNEDLKNKNLANIDKLLDRAYGRSVQAIDLTQKPNDLPEGIHDLEEYEKYLDEKARLLDEPEPKRKNRPKKGKGKTPSS